MRLARDYCRNEYTWIMHVLNGRLVLDSSILPPHLQSLEEVIALIFLAPLQPNLSGRGAEEAPPGFEPGMADLQSAALAAWLRRHVGAQ